jgi:transcription initiation factor IIE alpha subunit
MFCYRACFIDYHRQQRLAYPLFICPECESKIELDFAPRRNKEKWHGFFCPTCGYNVSNQYGDFEVIKQIKIAFRRKV